MSIPIISLNGWVRAIVWYPVMVYGDHYYTENLSRFKFPQNTKTNGRLFSLEWFGDKEKVSVFTIFGYNQIGIHLNIDIKLEEYNDRFIAITVAMKNIMEGYKEFKKYFLEEICPNNVSTNTGEKFNFENEKLLIDVSEFFYGQNLRQCHILQKKIYTLLQKYSSNVEFILFDKKLKTQLKKETKNGSDFSYIFASIERIGFVILHHRAIQALIFDPSKDIIGVCLWGYISTMELLDLHYDIVELNDLISEESLKIESLSKSKIPIGFDLHDEEITRLRLKANNIGNNLEELVSLSREIDESLLKPFNFSGIEINIREYSQKARSLVNNMDSLPISQFEAQGILETYELGGLRKVRESVDDLDSRIKILRIESTRKINVLQIILLIGLSVAILAIICVSGIDISGIADALQIVTFFLAIILLIISIGSIRIVEAFSSIIKKIKSQI